MRLTKLCFSFLSLSALLWGCGDTYVPSATATVAGSGGMGQGGSSSANGGSGGSGLMCGNGEKEAGEECDDGNLEPADGCTPDCRVPKCGDGKADAGEVCFKDVAAYATLKPNVSDLVVTDCDKDGDVDVVVGANDYVVAMRNSGGGVFDSVVASNVYGDVGSLEAGELLNNGGDDIAIGFMNDDYVPVFAQVGNCNYDGSWTFTVGATTGGRSVRMLDRDGDKQLDIVTASSSGLAFGSSSEMQLTNIGLGGSTTVMAAADFSGDGRDDVALFQGAAGLAVYKSTGATFTNGSPYYQLGELVALEAGDLDGDGDIDLVGLRLNNRVVVLRNEGVSAGSIDFATLTPTVRLNGGSFTPTEEPTDLVLVDFDNDGVLDVVVGSVAGGAIKFLRNDGSGKLTLIGEGPDAAGITAIGAVDVNGDQLMDIVAASNDPGSQGSARLLVFVANP